MHIDRLETVFSMSQPINYRQEIEKYVSQHMMVLSSHLADYLTPQVAAEALMPENKIIVYLRYTDACDFVERVRRFMDETFCTPITKDQLMNFIFEADGTMSVDPIRFDRFRKEAKVADKELEEEKGPWIHLRVGMDDGLLIVTTATFSLGKPKDLDFYSRVLDQITLVTMGTNHFPKCSAQAIERVHDTITKTCGTCHKEGKFNKCGACKVKCYCSIECQKKDWKKHKHTCKLHPRCLELLDELRKKFKGGDPTERI